jgi:hypothetical protein
MADADVLGARMRHSRFDGANGMRPRKLLSQLLKMISLLEEGSMEDIDAAHGQFLKELSLYEFSMKKIQVVSDTSVREVEAYKALRDDLRDSMRKTETEIAELKERVAHERVVRKNKEEYAVLAKQVLQFDSRTKTQSDSAVIQEDLQQLEEQTQKQMAKMEYRKKQMLLLLHLVEDLKSNMDDEGPEAEAPAAAGGQGADVEMTD